MKSTELIHNLGEKIGLALEFDADGACSFEANDMVVTLIDLPQADCIVLSGDLGEPPPEHLEALYKKILEAQFLFRDTAGATISVNPEDGHFALCRQLPCPTLEPATFLTAVKHFIHTLGTYADIVKNFRAENADSAAETIALPPIADGFFRA